MDTCVKEIPSVFDSQILSKRRACRKKAIVDH